MDAAKQLAGCWIAPKTALQGEKGGRWVQTTSSRRNPQRHGQNFYKLKTNIQIEFSQHPPAIRQCFLTRLHQIQGQPGCFRVAFLFLNLNLSCCKERINSREGNLYYFWVFVFFIIWDAPIYFCDSRYRYLRLSIAQYQSDRQNISKLILNV